MASDLETQMVSVERVREYSEEIAVEAPAGATAPAPWPSQGAVHLRDLALRYRPGLEPAIRGLTCEIRGGEKIGVCGRTGAGKSSLILGLLRIVEADCGSVSIDGVDISTLSLDFMRQSIAVIPQVHHCS